MTALPGSKPYCLYGGRTDNKLGLADQCQPKEGMMERRDKNSFLSIEETYDISPKTYRLLLFAKYLLHCVLQLRSYDEIRQNRMSSELFVY